MPVLVVAAMKTVIMPVIVIHFARSHPGFIPARGHRCSPCSTANRSADNRTIAPANSRADCSTRTATQRTAYHRIPIDAARLGRRRKHCEQGQSGHASK